MSKTRYWPMVVALLAVGEVVLNLPDYDLPISVYIIFVMLIIQIVILSVRPKPKLESLGVNVIAIDVKGSSLNRKGDKLTAITSNYVIISLANNPKIRSDEANATNAYAKIFTYKKNREQAFPPYIGVWAVEYSPPFIGNKFQEKITIDSNGYPERLILAKHKIVVENDSGEIKTSIEVSPVDKTSVDNSLVFISGRVFGDEPIFYKIQIFASNYKSKYIWAIVQRTKEALAASVLDSPPFDVKE